MPKLVRRRFVTVGALLAAVCTILAGCTLSSRLPDEKVVLTTFTVLADIASEVAGDRLQVESITKPGAEIHGYEPTPGDIRRAATASLVLDNGLNLEAWFAQFVDGLDGNQLGTRFSPKVDEHRQDELRVVGCAEFGE